MAGSKKIHTYAFDFDGVIAQYDGFKGANHAEKPIKEVVKAIRILKKQGHKILIYSTRGNRFLKKYCQDYNIPIDYFNINPEQGGENKNKPVAYAYIDDRAVNYHAQSAEKLVKELNNFEVYWKK